MQTLRAPVPAGLACPARAAARRPAVRSAAQVETASAPSASSSNGNGAGAAPASSPDEIYIGFAKGDTAPRAGRKGRVIRDDPSKYPSKEDLGLLTGATGGWAGGEAGLWKLREQVLAEKSGKKAPPPPAVPSKPAVPKPQGGKAPIYIGYGKSDSDLRKAGAPGRFILDDPTKYPAKEDVGFLSGATGGFAAGEKGLRQFLRDGELQLRKEGDPGGQGMSPVALAGILVLAGAGGGLLLNGAADFTEGEIKGEIVNAPIDDSTKTLLLAAVALLGAVGLLGAGRAAAASLSERVASGAQRLVLLGAFWVAVFLAARAILEL